MRRKPGREGQLWWQDWPPNNPVKGQWILVIGRSKKDNPTYHHVVISRAGQISISHLREHALRTWDDDGTFHRIL